MTGRVGEWARLALGWGTVVAVAVAVQAAFLARPSRWWAEERMGMREGVDAWGAAAFLCGVALVGLLIACVLADRGWWWRWAVLLVPASGFGWAASGAWREWRALLEERAGPRDYDLVIPVAFGVTVWASVVVVVLTVVLVGAQVIEGRRVS